MRFLRCRFRRWLGGEGEGQRVGVGPFRDGAAGGEHRIGDQLPLRSQFDRRDPDLFPLKGDFNFRKIDHQRSGFTAAHFEAFEQRPDLREGRTIPVFPGSGVSQPLDPDRAQAEADEFGFPSASIRMAKLNAGELSASPSPKRSVACGGSIGTILSGR